MMKIPSFHTFRRAAALFGLMLLLSLSAWAQQAGKRHTVAAGETLYRISRTYGVSVEQIMSVNPGLRPETLKAGMTISIPSNGETAVSSSQTGDGPGGSHCREMHKVKKKETLWGIANQYGITVAELMRANPDVDTTRLKNGKAPKLKKGMFLCIPYKSEPAPQAPVYKGYKELSIAIVLPLLSGKEEAKRSLEFYRGFLMAVEDMKKSGTDIRITAIDEPDNVSGIPTMTNKLLAASPQLIIGPLYPVHLQAFADYTASLKNVKWVIPFTSKFPSISRSPQAFMMNTPDLYKARVAAELFVKNFRKPKVVFLHENGSREMAFAAELRNALKAEGLEIGDLPSGYTVTQMHASLAPQGKTIFVPEVSDAKGTAALMAKMEKLSAMSRAAGQTFSFLGYPEWMNEGYATPAQLSAADAYLCMPYFYDENNTKVQHFINLYTSWFHEPLINVSPRLALSGYDTGTYLMQGLKKYGADFGEQPVKARSYQTDLRFVRTGSEGGCVNGCMYFIHYKPNGSMEKIGFE